MRKLTLGSINVYDTRIKTPTFKRKIGIIEMSCDKTRYLSQVRRIKRLSGANTVRIIPLHSLNPSAQEAETRILFDRLEIWSMQAAIRLHGLLDVDISAELAK